MAEALITFVIQQLAKIPYEQAKEAVTLAWNGGQDIAEFGRKLEKMQALLQDAEKKQVVEESVRRWLDELKDVSYKMDDVVDQWNTEIGIRELVENQENEEGDNSPKTQMEEVCFSVLTHCLSFCQSQFTEVARRHNIARTIRDLTQELTQIQNEAIVLNLLHTTPAIVVERPNNARLTSSFVDISTIFGRDAEKDRLVSELVRGESRRSHQLVIPIVGMGGLGKTTFTQLVFRDAQVEAYFDKQAWVCVSDPFDVIKVAKAINDELGSTQVNSNELDLLLKNIEKNIKDKKIFLVLDDVWTEDETEWGRLSLPLIRTCAEGSKILVTTRKQEVARMMRATSDMIINLVKLNESDSLELFNSVAFLGREQDKSKKGFGDTAKKIVRKCGGLPLVLKTLGGLLLHKQTIREWEEVLNSEIWKIKVVQEDVFRPLLLSYYDLAPEIKNCLLYCSTFPKDFKFSIEMLIEQWMSQGYLNVGENREEITEGREVFNKLVMRCFFQDFQKHALTKEIIGCKMHDTVHDFVQFLTQNECYTMEATSTHGIETWSANDTTKPRPGDKVRHLTLMFGDKGSFPSSISSIVNCEILRTLATFGSRSNSIDSNLIRRLKRLRTLKLSSNFIKKVPEEIGDLMHLRYIDLSRNELNELPDSVCNLYNLQTLRLDSCTSLEKLPDNMGKLINLKHLHVYYCHLLRYLPKGIGSIRNLRTLDGDGPVYCSEDAEALTLGDLSMMNQLRRLSIQIKIKRIGEDAWTRILSSPISSWRGDDIFSPRDLDPPFRNEGPRFYTSLGLGMRFRKNATNFGPPFRNGGSRFGGGSRFVSEEIRYEIGEERMFQDAAPSKAEKAELRKKELLSHLKLYLPRGVDDNLHAGLIDALQPHENLESLILDGYKGSTWPTWMTTSYLTRLTALRLDYGCSSVLPPLGKLPSLKVLKLSGNFNLKEIGGEFFGVEETSSSSFPSLETLVLYQLLELEKWELGRGEAEDSSNSQIKSISIMPRLSSLYIVNCGNKLKQLPDFLLQNEPLQNLLIVHWDSFGSLPDLELISRIRNVTIIRNHADSFIQGRKIDYDPIQD